MHLDKHGLPVQRNGDNLDQLHRVGMVISSVVISGDMKLPKPCPLDLWVACYSHLMVYGQDLQPAPGLFARFIGGNPNNVSADQLIPIIAGHVLLSDGPVPTDVGPVFWAMIRRWGFAQNTHDGLTTKPANPSWIMRKLGWEKVPDFLFLRAMPLFIRRHWIIHWLCFWVFDLYLLLLVVGDWLYQKKDKDPADINNTLLTLVVCRVRFPSFWSCLACRLWKRLRPDIMGAMRRYHRAESGGNPEIAEMWAPIVDKVFG